MDLVWAQEVKFTREMHRKLVLQSLIALNSFSKELACCHVTESRQEVGAPKDADVERDRAGADVDGGVASLALNEAREIDGRQHHGR